MCYKKIRVHPQIHLELYPTFWTWKIFPGQVDGVVSKTRRRSSLWIILTTVERVVTGCTKSVARWSTVTLKLHYFDLCWICCTAFSFSVVQQLARLRLPRRVARSLCASRASRCCKCLHAYARAFRALGFHRIYDGRESCGAPRSCTRECDGLKWCALIAVAAAAAAAAASSMHAMIATCCY